MQKRNAYALGIVAVILLSASAYAVTLPQGPGRYDAFAQCLTDNGDRMYGTLWCSHCNDQKNRFGSSFSYVDFTDCDASVSACKEQGIQAYPTWIINGVKYTGTKSLEELSLISGCSLE
jgi:hypothetical protein